MMPNGRSIVLERQPGAGAEGYAGLEDEVDNHWGMLFKAAILSTVLSVGSEAGMSGNNNGSLAEAIQQGTSQSINQTGQQVVSRSLSIQPTITIRPGFPVRVIVTHDLVLEPYRACGGPLGQIEARRHCRRKAGEADGRPSGFPPSRSRGLRSGARARDRTGRCLQRFMATDRAFAKLRRGAVLAGQAP